MGKKRNRNKANTQLQPTHEKNGQFAIWKMVTATSVIISLLAGMYTFYPKISVAPAEVFEKDDPLSVVFSLNNEGLTSIYSVTFECIGHEIIGDPDLIQFRESTYKTPSDYRAKIEPGEYAVFHCAHGSFGPKVARADIELQVLFSLRYWPVPIARQFAYSFRTSTDGKPHWYPKDVKPA